MHEYMDVTTGYAVKQKVCELLSKKNSLLAIADTFARTRMKEETSDSFSMWEMRDPKLDLKLMQASDLLGNRPFMIDEYAYGFYVRINNLFINLKNREYKNVYYDEHGWRARNLKSVSEITITPDGKLMKSFKNHLIPLSMKEFCAWYKNECTAGQLIHTIADELIRQNIFFKDVLEDMLATGAILPVTINEVMSCHNRAELLCTKYKAAKTLHIKWNKQNLNLSYLIIKSMTYVDGEKNRNILLNQKDMDLISGDIAAAKRNGRVYPFLINVITKNLQAAMLRSEEKTQQKIQKLREKYEQELSENVMTGLLDSEKEQFLKEKVNTDMEGEASWENICRTIHDYVYTCKARKKKVRLDIYSISELLNLHDLVTTRNVNYRRETKEVKVPKDSRFNHLREILPPEFEWIKDRKRLILETELQHHCVWSYTEYISRDISAIYSFVDSNAEHCPDGIPKRYTVEFRLRGNRYYVEQVQGKYDRVNANRMQGYIQQILDSHQYPDAV